MFNPKGGSLGRALGHEPMIAPVDPARVLCRPPKEELAG